MSGQSLGFVVVETTRRVGCPDDLSLCWMLPGGAHGLLPDEVKAERERDRLAAHAALDADLDETVGFTYSVAEVISR